jgi:hypothetical protein
MSTPVKNLDPATFVATIAARYGFSEDALLVKYLERKTKAATRGAKARRSLGNVYALLVVSQDFVAGKVNGSRFTELLARMKNLPFGSKLQNHPLDNRLNDEFRRQMGVDGDLLPIQATSVDGQKARRVSPALLAHDGMDPIYAAQFIVDVVEEYVRLITEKQTSYLDEIHDIGDADELAKFLVGAFVPSSDARLFEIVSFVLLAEHFRNRTLWVGKTKADVAEESLRLFRSGRTNANDGGIDFVLKPSGRFFQVTETLDFGKYFLDFEKVNRFPLSFVVKVEAEAVDAEATIRTDALRSGRYTKDQVEVFMALFDEVFTLPDLRRILSDLPGDATSVDRMKGELALQFQLEYGLLD